MELQSMGSKKESDTTDYLHTRHLSTYQLAYLSVYPHPPRLSKCENDWGPGETQRIKERVLPSLLARARWLGLQGISPVRNLGTCEQV